MTRTIVLVAALLSLAGCGEVLQSSYEPRFDSAAEDAEDAAKKAHDDQVAAYKLCLSVDRVAAGDGAEVKDAIPQMAMPACVDPGPLAQAPQVSGSTPEAPVAAQSAAKEP